MKISNNKEFVIISSYFVCTLQDKLLVLWIKDYSPNVQRNKIPFREDLRKASLGLAQQTREVVLFHGI